MELYDKILEASKFLKGLLPSTPNSAIIAGTGLNGLADQLLDATVIPFEDIPHFVKSTVDSHTGKLVYGILNGKSTICLQGRFHYYEGYSMEEVTFPTRVLANLGVSNLFITNASGSLNPDIKAGDIVLVKDHISFFGPNPLRGLSDQRLGERFPDMTNAYDHRLITKINKAANSLNLTIKSGIYLYVQGPSLETPAEHNLMRLVGADLVGMSTVPEVIIAKQCGLNVSAISIATNECFHNGKANETSLEEVISVANECSSKVAMLLKELI